MKISSNKQSTDTIVKYLQKLNDELHNHKIRADKRAILFSSILIALDDQIFTNTYEEYNNNPKELIEHLLTSIKRILEQKGTSNSQIEAILVELQFIKTETVLNATDYLSKLINNINQNIHKEITANKDNFDLISHIYSEFLRYLHSDKVLGIVLTPPHITELFCDLAEINENSVIFDNCCGTGGFLITALKQLISKANNNAKKIEQIKEKQIIGIEQQASLFALCSVNMIIHGDSKPIILKGSCFDQKLMSKVKDLKPTIGLLNPPYQSTKDSIPELEFILNNLEAIQQNGKVVAIIPISSVIETKGKSLELKQKILENHTLEAVISVNDELFNPMASPNTVIIVITAHKPHPKNYKTYLGYWKEDGFIKRKNIGRIETKLWASLRTKYLDSYKNRLSLEGISTNAILTAENEWCAEEYMQTGYSSSLKIDDFEETLRKLIAFNVVHNKTGSIKVSSEQFTQNAKKLELNTENWKWFKYEELFTIARGQLNDEQDNDTDEYKTLLIGASQNENGSNNEYIKSTPFYDTKDLPKITVGNGGNTGCGQAFYQNIPFNAKPTVNVLDILPKHGQKLNMYIGIFLVTLIKLEQFRFNFGRGWSISRMKKSEIKLPVDKNGKPDWKFMEEFIKSLPYGTTTL